MALQPDNRNATCLSETERFFPMKRISFYAAFPLFVFLTGLRAQAPAPNPQEQQILSMIKEVQAQQQAIAENQAKIEAKLATVSESLRIAKIYSVRGGGK